MVAVGVALLVVSSVRMQGALIDEVDLDVAGRPEDERGFLPMLAQGPSIQDQERVLRSGTVPQTDVISNPEGAGADLFAEPNGTEVDNRPVRLVIPAIGLDAPVVGSALLPVESQAANLYQWRAPDAFAVGWHFSSAQLGESGNTVLNGHHNAFGEVFRDLEALKKGDRIFAFANEDAASYQYEVTDILILEERSQPIETRLRNARLIGATSDERLTLITCWPYVSNTHRLIIIARPLRGAAAGGELHVDQNRP